MNNNDIGQSIAILIAGVFLGFIAGIQSMDWKNESQAIRVGVGYYNPTSGSFEWRTNMEPVRLTLTK
jgi:hypothetical protein